MVVPTIPTTRRAPHTAHWRLFSYRPVRWCIRVGPKGNRPCDDQYVLFSLFLYGGIP